MSPSSHLKGDGRACGQVSELGSAQWTPLGPLMVQMRGMGMEARIKATGGAWNKDSSSVLTQLFVADVDIETQDYDIGEEGSPPVDDEHHHTAQHGSSKRDPHVVVCEAGTPPCNESHHDHKENIFVQ